MTQMNTLCDLSPYDVEKKLKASRKRQWKEDFLFLLGQRQFPQIGRMTSVDRNEARRANNQLLRSSRTSTPLLPTSTETFDEAISVDSNESEEISQFSVTTKITNLASELYKQENLTAATVAMKST